VTVGDQRLVGKSNGGRIICVAFECLKSGMSCFNSLRLLYELPGTHRRVPLSVSVSANQIMNQRGSLAGSLLSRTDASQCDSKSR
jgi:hypothetical protein